ncbi:MAG: hypothetical protein P8Z34_00325 [Anaerolineales bacterium]
MSKTELIALPILVCLFMLVGCSNEDRLSENDIPDISDLTGEVDSPPVDFGGESGGFQFGSSAQWPDYIPADIPELKGQISTVMAAPESHIRIFYENITEGQIEDYLAELQAAGFQLEYIVYTREGFPDNSAEKIEKGEYDAVDITKGEYHMRLEFGGSEATYDIYTTGFEAEVIAATTPQWPVALIDIAPPPERCKLTSVNQTSRDGLGYTIMCEPADDGVFEDYADALYAIGFHKDANIVSVNESENLWLTDGETSIRIMYSLTSELMLTIEKEEGNASPALTWPQELEGLIPPPERCEIANVFPSQDVLLECTPADAEVLQDYLDVLVGLGFVQSHALEGVNGEIITVTLTDDGVSIELMAGSADSIMIRIVQDNP